MQRSTAIKGGGIILEKETVGYPNSIFSERSLWRANLWVWYILAIIEVFLFFRVFLQIIGADPSNIFTLLVYYISYIFTLPFSGIRQPTIIENSVIEWSTFIAIAVYAIIAVFVALFLRITRSVSFRR